MSKWTKPKKLFAALKEMVAVLSKEEIYKMLIQQSIQQLNLASSHVERLCNSLHTP